jgi:uncharacterized protein YecE (DUF72 family)
MATVHVGTSGWSYPAGAGTWNGVFYPAEARAGGSRGRFDELRFYAEHFDTVEVNSSFYRTPTPQTARSWVRRTPASFLFSIKLFQKFTHSRMVLAAGAGAPSTAAARSAPAASPPEAAPTAGDVAAFKACLDPIAGAGKLGALLAQFPPSFKRDDGTRGYLDWLLETFREYSMAVELRHRSWSDAEADTTALLAEYGAAWAQIDEPKFRMSVRQTFRPNVPGIYYMRLHGRNAAHWWEHEKAEDRYNYLYSPDELEPVAATVDAVGHLVKRLYLYFNNHFAAKAVANAAMLKHELGLEVGGEYPASFVEAYPSLGSIVATSSSPASRRLF